MKLGFASDHRGYKLKEELKNKFNYLEIVDYGTNDTNSCDYPDYAHKLCLGLLNKEIDFGVCICGSGIGISIACNKHKGIYCAKVSNKEEALHTRLDNNTNVIAFGESISLEDAYESVKTFIETEYSNLDKHNRRINKVKEIESGNLNG